MLYTESEKAWLERRAEEIALERGWSHSIALSAAAAQLIRNYNSGHSAQIITLPTRKPKRCADDSSAR